MNDADSSLERLLRAATRARLASPTEAPYSLEARILGAWRRGLDPDSPSLLLPVLQKAFVCACAILVISAALSLHFLGEAPAPANELAVVDSAIQLTLTQ